MKRINDVCVAAHRILERDGRRRSPYAHDVIDGVQCWSGADLQGKARRFGASYHYARGRATSAWQQAGGKIIAVDHGRLVSAVVVGTDDYGNSIYETHDGPVVQYTAERCKRAFNGRRNTENR